MILQMVKSGTCSFYNKSLGTFDRIIYSVRVCISHYVFKNIPRYVILSERGTIVDIFHTIQTVRNTCFHLKGDEEQ